MPDPTLDISSLYLENPDESEEDSEEELKEKPINVLAIEPPLGKLSEFDLLVNHVDLIQLPPNLQKFAGIAIAKGSFPTGSKQYQNLPLAG